MDVIKPQAAFLDACSFQTEAKNRTLVLQKLGHLDAAHMVTLKVRF